MDSRNRAPLAWLALLATLATALVLVPLWWFWIQMQAWLFGDID